MKEKQIWSISWFFGSGAQAYLLPLLTSHDLILAMHSKIHGRGWGLLTVDQYRKLVKENHYLYEVITNRKRKLYFDIDSMGRDTLDECKSVILSLLPDAELQISGSRPENEEGKFSYHIVVSNYHFDNVDEMSGVRSFCRIHESIGFDWKVYTKNRQMKCINQSKIDGPLQKVIMGDVNDKHAITAFFETGSKNCYLLFEEFVGYQEPVVFNRIKQERRRLPVDLANIVSNPPELIKLLPVECDHRVSYMVALYHLKLGMSFETFWSWASKKDGSEGRLKKWRDTHWPKLEEINSLGKNNVSDESVIKVLERYYPNVRKDYYTRLFLDYCQVPLDVDTKERYVVSTNLTEKRVNYLVFPMGSGKTKAICDWVRTNDESCIFLNCRISLAQNIMSRLPDSYVHYKDDKKLRRVCATHGHNFTSKDLREIKVTGIPLCDRLVTTPNSVHYIGDRSYDTVIIDEFEMFQTAWTSVETHTTKTKKGQMNNYMTNWNTTKRLLQNAKKVIIMDALPSFNSFNFFSRLGISANDIDVIGTSFKCDPINVEMVDGAKEMIKLMISKLSEGKRIYVFWPYKTPSSSDKVVLSRLSCSELMAMLEKHTTRAPLCGKIYTADTIKDKVMKDSLLDVNNSWSGCDVVIVNQSITIGVNFDVSDYFDSVFLGDASFVSHRELIQTSRRIRSTISQTIYYCNLGGQLQPCYSLEKLPNDSAIRENVRDVFNEKKSKSVTTVKHLFSLANMIVNIDKSDYGKLPRIYKKYLARDERYKWANIDLIEDPDVYERLCIYGAECVEDVLRISKYQFIRFWRDGIPEEICSDLWDKRNLVIRIREFYNCEDSWIDRLFEELSIERKSFAIPVKFRMSDKLRDYLKSNYTFQRVDINKVTDMYLVGVCLQSYFNFPVYEYDVACKKYLIDEDFKETYCLFRHWNDLDYIRTLGSFLNSDCLI